MDEHQLKAILKVMNEGYKETISVISRNSADHDLLIRIDTRLDQMQREADISRKILEKHISESVPFRDSQNICAAHIENCNAEKHHDKIKYHDRVIGIFLKFGWAVFVGLQALTGGIVLYVAKIMISQMTGGAA